MVCSGWFSEDPWELSEQFGGTWRTADFSAGDALVFGPLLLHKSTKNTSGLARVSCDTRWYPATAQPDPRYVGAAVEERAMAPKFGVYAKEEGGDGGGGSDGGGDGGVVGPPPPKRAGGSAPPAPVTMAQLKAEWGLDGWLG